MSFNSSFVCIVALIGAAFPVGSVAQSFGPTLDKPGCFSIGPAATQILCVERYQGLMGKPGLRYRLYRVHGTVGAKRTLSRRVVTRDQAAQQLKGVDENAVRRLKPSQHKGGWRIRLPGGTTLMLRLRNNSNRSISIAFRRRKRTRMHYVFPSGLVLSHYSGKIKGTTRLEALYDLRASRLVMLVLDESYTGQRPNRAPDPLGRSFNVLFYTYTGDQLKSR